MEPTHFESLYPDNSRFSEIEKIFGFVKLGNSCQLIGIRGSGRSSILGLLSYNRNIRIKHVRENHKWFHFVNLNFLEVQNKALSDVTKFIFLELIDSLYERKMDEEHKEIEKIFKEVVSLNDELVLFQGLKRAIYFLSIEKELTIVFLFDNFESYASMLTNDFFSNLRTLRDHAKYRFSVVFSLTRSLDSLIDSVIFSDFYEFLEGNSVYVSLFDKPSFDFETAYIEKVNNKKIDKKIIDQILFLTSGHSGLTRLSEEAVLQNENIDDLEKLLLSQRVISSSLFKLWEYLTPSEKHFLLCKNAKNATASEEKSAFLEHVGILKNKEIAIPLFKTFVCSLEENVKNDEEKKGFVFDPASNSILSGEQILSDKLTSSEFKLLLYLLQNKGKIIERNDLINAVWGDNKSQAGVTDQALDQLIFRLRKKIEEDPNNPQNIETLKGRGFRFNG